MKHTILVTVYLLVMGGTIVLIDVLFLRDHFTLRLITNVSIVFVFALVYILALRNLFK